MNGLRATLRLQFHQGFTLDDAVPLVGYFAALGVSHVYASPLLAARPGSRHGYDVIDPTRINPELGGEAALRRLVAELRRHGLGLILDIVSNHMAVGGAGNPWWLDVLEWGRRSPYASFFDIQWNSPDPLLEGQLLVPFLSSDYGEMLQNGEIPLRFDATAGSFQASHHEHRFPISPPSYAEILGATDHPALRALAGRFAALRHEADPRAQAVMLRAELAQLAQQQEVAAAIGHVLERYDSRQPEGLQRLHALLERQSYRLASWRTAADDINWRRFFDINELGGLRIERPRVFEATHAKIFQLLEEGLIDGLRIDHVDGLADPHGYCRRLRRRLDRLAADSPGRPPLYVEKILGQGEELHRDWQVDGTTGYEFMNQVSLLQHDPDGEAGLRGLWHNLSGRPADFLEEAREARRLILASTLAGDFESVAQALLQVARGDLMTRDITLGQIRRALRELIVHYPVYRTYLNACGRPAEDEPFFRQALEGARVALGDSDGTLLGHLERWFGGQPWRRLPRPLRKPYRHAGVRFQQVTAPAAAKAVEDTALYRSAALLSRNDVGFDSQRFAAPPADFHAICQKRREAFPDNLLATATHDHKRGEDARARLAVLSERAGWYGERVQHWLLLATPLRQLLPDGPAPTPGDELILYQTLLGSWPPELAADDAEGLAAYAGRLRQWQEKTIREAKLRSSWSAPNAAYEEACRDFLGRLLEDEAMRELRGEIAAAAAAIGPAGALNGLAQTLLKLTVPGVPDLYQGTEFWDFSLVDPDNRRPVDFAARRQALQQDANPAELLARWRDSSIKQWLIVRTLALRARHPALFAEGDYRPLEVIGQEAERLFAFARHQDAQWALVLVPRLACPLLGESDRPLVEPPRWGDTRVRLPADLPYDGLQGIFSGTVVTTHTGELSVSEALKAFPVGLFFCDRCNGESP